MPFVYKTFIKNDIIPVLISLMSVVELLGPHFCLIYHCPKLAVQAPRLNCSTFAINENSLPGGAQYFCQKKKVKKCALVYRPFHQYEK